MPGGAPDHPDRPLRRDAERNRRRILAAAREMFAARGLEVTMDDIAHHAGVGVGTVYRRFPNKELLIDALFENRIGEIVALAERALGVPDAWDGLVAFMEGSVELQAQDRGLREVVLGATHGRDRVARARELIAPKVAELVQRAKDAGHLRQDLAVADVPLAFMMLGAIADYTHDVEPQLWRRYLALVLDGLRPSRTAPSPLDVPALDDDQLDEAMRGWRP